MAARRIRRRERALGVHAFTPAELAGRLPQAGFRTAFIHRPEEWGHEPPPQPTPDPAQDIVADDLNDMAEKLGA